MYEYRARLIRVIDGDTVRLAVDLGFSAQMEMTVRLLDVNCPESNTPEGVAARVFTIDWFDRYGFDCTLRTHKDRQGREVQTFSRYVGELYPLGRDWTLNNDLVEAGHAVRKEY